MAVVDNVALHLGEEAMQTELEWGSEMSDIVIFTDGSCLHNPGRGGWAAIINDGRKRRELSGGFRLSTNNRMEIKAAIEALRAVEPDLSRTIKVYADSQLLVNGIELGWARKWRANNWKRNKNDKAENPDLWKQLLEEIEQRRVKFIWTKAHAGTPENERCDELAKAAAEQATAVDEAYEHSKMGSGSISAPPAGSSVTRKSDSNYVVEHDPKTSLIRITHPQNGSMVVPTSELTDLIRTIQTTLQQGE